MRGNGFRRYASVLLIFALFVSGCSWIGATGAKPFTQMTVVEKATYFQEMYVKQFDDTKAMGELPVLTAAQLKIYNTKKTLLEKVKPMIKAYRMIVVGGGTPNASDEQAINDIINQLLSAGL